MHKIEITLPEIKLVGIKVRTKNADEINHEAAKISPMVNRYFAENLASKISNRTKPGVNYIVYCEYESNYTGYYTCIIAEEVSSLESLSDNFVSYIIPTQKYLQFISDPGKMPDIVIQSWQEIWQMQEIEKIRNYKSDFEIYDFTKEFDPSNAKAKILIGVK